MKNLGVEKGRTGKITTKYQPLNLRSGPSTSNAVLRTIPIGATIEIKDVTNPSGNWVWVKTDYLGTIGWACAHKDGASYWYITMDQTIASNITPKWNYAVASSFETDALANKNKNDSLANSLLNANADANYNYGVQGIDGSGVQYENNKIAAESDDYVTKYLSGAYDKYQQNIRMAVNNDNDPKYVQNAYGFPRLIGRVNDTYKYNYYIDMTDYEDDFERLRNNLNFGRTTRRGEFLLQQKYYNRFKVATRENQLARSFAHIFFIRPDLNIMNYVGGGQYELTQMVKNDSNYYYAFNHCPEVLQELIHTQDGRTHDFMWLLSNKASSFELSDEYIGTDTYGEAYSGHKIPYGKSDTESKTSNTFNIQYDDDRDLHIYHLHKIWTDYISKMYKGKFRPRDNYAREKILDYASAVYYILTAEDGETIIFWSKYYGVFPTNSPSSSLSYQKGNLVKIPQFTINYTYAFKEDFNPLTLVEFNMHSPKESLYKYAKSYQKTILGTGKTWVNAPFVETFKNMNGLDLPYTFKLRFRKGDQ